jgi:flagellar motility protein MotE (MotC chaperone)
MKTKFVYITVFAMAFAAVTSAIFYMNMKYKNIFRMDFTPEMAAADSLTTPPLTGDLHAAAISDSLGVADSLHSEYVSNETVDSLKLLREKIAELNAELTQKEEELATIKNIKIEARDSSYQDWKKQTVKLYESMDAKKAAKIIASYSDDVARDILYALKKKKAAEILAQLNVETATRLTRAN